MFNKKYFKYALSGLKAVVLVFSLSVLSFSLSYFALAAAWTGPGNNPPNPNTEPPINTGVGNQSKVGWLGVGGAFAPAYALDVNGAIRLQPSGIPANSNGAIYYDSASNKFQCYENGAWKNCIDLTGGGWGAGGGGQVAFFDAAKNIIGDNAFYWDDNNKILDLGFSNAGLNSSILDMAGDLTHNGMNLRSATAVPITSWTHVNANIPRIRLINARGAINAPTAVQDTDLLGIYGFYGYDGSTWMNEPAAAIIGAVDGTPSVGKVPGQILFSTKPDGGTNVLLRMIIKGNGNVGIGTPTPGYKLEVDGDAANQTGVWAVVSDERLKKDIQPLGDALGTILKLKGVSFRWKDSGKDSEYGLQRGFIAQDVEKVIPEWVKTDSNGYKSLEKTGIDALTVEAIKEQQKEIEQLKAIVCADHTDNSYCK